MSTVSGGTSACCGLAAWLAVAACVFSQESPTGAESRPERNVAAFEISDLAAELTKEELGVLEAEMTDSPELRELYEHRTELKALAERERARFKQIDEVFKIRFRLTRAYRLMKRAEADGKPNVDELRERVHFLYAVLEHKQDLSELGEEIQELRQFAGEATEMGEVLAVEVLRAAVVHLAELQDIRQRIFELEFGADQENATSEEELEDTEDDVYRSVEHHREMVELVHELAGAIERDNEQAANEIRRGLRRLQAKDVTQRPEPIPVDDTKPVILNDEIVQRYASGDLHRDAAPLLKTYCFECHGNEGASGELNLEKLLAESPIVTNRDKWVNVIEQSKNHVMPPEDGDQPSLEERTRLVAVLHNAIYNFDYSDIRDPGFEAARRLTHQEYSNTVRDLFGLRVSVTSRFPSDLSGTSGFDNSANTLFIQPLLMERYLSVAELVVDTAAATEGNEVWTSILHSNLASHPDKTSEIFGRFLRRAYRRPPTVPEIERSVSQVGAALNRGVDYDSALKAALQAVLITPQFLLITETSGEGLAEFPVDQWELASRLSYFLWASMPDDELLALAEANRLRDPDVLSRQVLRMIQDSRADTLGSIFAAQWLGSQHLGTRMRLDPIDNPWCTETLMAAMRDETAMFFCSLVRENQSITKLIDADYTYLNEELARLYKIKGVSGDSMQRVRIDPERRGGIFGQGSLLAVTSFPGRTSPVVRGKWILSEVLGTPPPPPPPNVSELPEDIEENRRLTFREKLELHRRKPNCAACHSQIDPLGFSLEHYDWFGRYREGGRRRKIDASGQLPNGTKFVGLPGLKEVIVQERRDDLVRQVTQKMLTYALGRQLEYYDEPAIRAITSTVAKDGYRFQTLINHIVQSYPFQYKRRRE